MNAFDALTGRFSPEDIDRLREVLDGPEPYLTPALIRAAAHEVLGPHGLSPRELRDRRAVILTRAWSRMRAGLPRQRSTGATALTRADVTQTARDLPYSQFFALEDAWLTHRRHGGGDTSAMPRAGFLAADAVVVLPYDPVRDRVLVIEQFRFGAYARGDRHPWLLEPIAGRIDPGETPAETAAREAQEEAGVQLARLHKVASYYPTAGGSTEFLVCYVAICDLPDESAGTGGLEAEDEDILSSLHAFDDLMTMCDADQLDTGPLYLCALWLARHRDRLRRVAGVSA